MAGLIDPHPAVKAAVPSASVSEGFIGDDFFHHGAFALAQSLRFFTAHMDFYPFEAFDDNPIANEYQGLDIYDFYLNAGSIEDLRPLFPASSPMTDTVLKNDTFSDYWASREVAPHLRQKPRVPVLHVNNWFDVEDQYGTLLFYQEMKAHDDSDLIRIVSGPWNHGGWRFGTGDHHGPFHYGTNTASYFREEILMPFLRHHLKDGPDPALPTATMFDCGLNKWRTYDQWPPAAAVRLPLYLGQDGTIRFAPPEEAEAFNGYIADPANPVPFIPRPNKDGWNDDYKLIDQSFTQSRDDVLVYSTGPLKEDITLCGPALARLFASTEGTDTDWVVKLIDVYPDDPDENEPHPTPGFHRLVLSDIFRAKFRDSYADPKPTEPGVVEQYDIPLLEQNYTFRKGHELVIHVQSSWFPLFDRNPNTFTHIPSASADDFRAVENKIYTSKKFPSHVELTVLPQG